MTELPQKSIVTFLQRIIVTLNFPCHLFPSVRKNLRDAGSICLKNGLRNVVGLQRSTDLFRSKLFFQSFLVIRRRLPLYDTFYIFCNIGKVCHLTVSFSGLKSTFLQICLRKDLVCFRLCRIEIADLFFAVKGGCAAGCLCSQIGKIRCCPRCGGSKLLRENGSKELLTQPKFLDLAQITFIPASLISL